jgi:hypothetical protein
VQAAPSTARWAPVSDTIVLVLVLDESALGRASLTVIREFAELEHELSQRGTAVWMVALPLNALQMVASAVAGARPGQPPVSDGLAAGTSCQRLGVLEPATLRHVPPSGVDALDTGAVER